MFFLFGMVDGKRGRLVGAAPYLNSFKIKYMSEVVKVYIETKQDCQRKIDSEYLVCSHCGGKREPIETVDNAHNPTFWPGCLACERFDYGVTPTVYEIARKLVDERYYVHYSHMDRPKDDDEKYKKYYRESQIGGTTSIVNNVLVLHKQINELNKTL